MSMNGLDGVLYRLPSGSRTTYSSDKSTLTEVENVRDLSVDMSKAFADDTTRGSNGMRTEKGTLKSHIVSFEAVHDLADADYRQLWMAHVNNTPKVFAILDRDKADTLAQGLYAEFEVSIQEKQENLEDVQKVTVELHLARGSAAPEWVGVTS